MNTINLILANYPYIIVFLMFIVGFYILILDKNLIKKIIGLNLVQGSTVIFYVLLGKINGGVPPVVTPTDRTEILSNPLPHVLMLTAIVVGIAITSLACALVYRIYKDYDTVNELKIIQISSKKQD